MVDEMRKSMGQVVNEMVKDIHYTNSAAIE